jgi:hypothetical protein
MLAGMIRGLLMLALLLLLVSTDDSLLMLACALCAGAIIGNDVFERQPLGIAVFAVMLCLFFDGLSAKGALMTAFLAPIGAAEVDGSISLMFVVLVGAYFFWELRRTAEFVDDEREDAMLRRFEEDRREGGLTT